MFEFRYPYFPTAKTRSILAELTRDLGSPVEFPLLPDHVLEIFRAVLDRREDLEFNLAEPYLFLSYPIVVLLSSLCARDREFEFLRYYVANFYAKQFKRAIRVDPNPMEAITQIFHALGLQIFQDPLDPYLSIPLLSYVRLVAAGGDEQARLVYQRLRGGAIRDLEMKDLQDLLREHLRRQIITKIATNTQQESRGIFTNPPELELTARVRDLLLANKHLVKTRETVHLTREMWPPCASNLYGRIGAGQNLTHHERVFLAVFLLATGATLEEAVEAFSPAPDFDERLTRYHLEHLSGLRGKKQVYHVHACPTLRSLGICRKASDPVCRKFMIKHPLNYYKFKKKRKMTGLAKK